MIYSMRQSLAEPKPLWEVLRLIYAPWILDNAWNVWNSIPYHLYPPISDLILHKIQAAFDIYELMSHGKLQIIYKTFFFEGCVFMLKDIFRILVQRISMYAT